MPDHRRWRRRIETRLMLAEAGFYLLSARIMLAFIPFPRLMRFVSHPTRGIEAIGIERLHKRKNVRQAIFVIRRRWRDKTTCLHRAIAAQVMLRRRGVSTTLYFGALKKPGQRLSTHAWVQDGEEGVIGYHTAQKDRYFVVASYPESKNPITIHQ